MPGERKFVMSIAGFDPSGGAGLLADMKTFEQHMVYGLSVNTANTIQTARSFYAIQWMTLEEVIATADTLLEAFPVEVVKTGIMQSFDFLNEVVTFVKSRNPQIRIVVDPVLSASAGFDFQATVQETQLRQVLEKIYLLTPNINEARSLTGEQDADVAARKLSALCHVLLKGGHSEQDTGVDYLYFHQQCIALKPTQTDLVPKHGSGCVLSAAIVANLAHGNDLLTSCRKAKTYIEKFLNSNSSPLGYHYV
jgi:hydroxymethylpyrimidine/phosphomethylpyrimidine kinase